MTRTPVHAEPGQRRGSPPGGPTDSGPFAPSKSPSTIRLGLSPNRRLPTDSAEEAELLSRRDLGPTLGTGHRQAIPTVCAELQPIAVSSVAPGTLHHGASGAARLAGGEGVKYRTSFGSTGGVPQSLDWAAQTPRGSGNPRRPYGSLDQSHPACRCARENHRIQA